MRPGGIHVNDSAYIPVQPVRGIPEPQVLDGPERLVRMQHPKGLMQGLMRLVTTGTVRSVTYKSLLVML
jgi:hypothetical protein